MQKKTEMNVERRNLKIVKFNDEVTYEEVCDPGDADLVKAYSESRDISGVLLDKQRFTTRIMNVGRMLIPVFEARKSRMPM